MNPVDFFVIFLSGLLLVSVLFSFTNSISLINQDSIDLINVFGVHFAGCYFDYFNASYNLSNSSIIINREGVFFNESIISLDCLIIEGGVPFCLKN